MHIVEEKWNEIKQKLKIEHDLSDISYKTWIEPLSVYDVINSVVYILIPLYSNNIGSLDYISQRYLLPFKVCISEITNYDYDVKFITEEETSSLNSSKKVVSNTPSSQMKSIYKQANLNEKYTFDTFVVGGNNNFAHAASLAVAESPGQIYNPLFLYGGVGLGKTHLMHSIAHFILDRNKDKKILYVTSESFTNELIDALKEGKNSESGMAAFREKYRNIDVLLIDDIQFIIGKERTQEEFFHTFNHLHASGKHIIISSDKPPKDIETLEARLRSRFECGLIADISSPDYETRMAILRKKVELDNFEKYNIPNDVMQYIATSVKSNIRELEGSLNRLIALHKLKNEEINIKLASEALKDIIISDENKEITPELIIEVVAEHFDISTSDLKGGKRSNNFVIPRQIAMYLCRNMTDTPLKTIGIMLGKKDHSTVSHGVDKVTEEIKENETLSNTIDIIKKKINAF